MDDISPGVLLQAIRWLQERLVFWMLGLSILCAMVMAYTLGSYQQLAKNQNDRIAELSDEVDLLEVRETNLLAWLRAHGIEIPEHILDAGEKEK